MNHRYAHRYPAKSRISKADKKVTHKGKSIGITAEFSAQNLISRKAKVK